MSVKSQTTRRRMAPEARREQILDVAQALFMARGWDEVTIAELISAAGISKGGFYHHFTAKEDVLTALVARMTAQAIAAAENLRAQTVGDALERLNAFLAGSLRWKAENIAEMRYLTDALTRPGNDMLFQRLFNATSAAVLPALGEMIREGVAEGLFNVADAPMTAEIILALSQGRRDLLNAVIDLARRDLDAATARLEDRMQVEGKMCDWLLGLPAGSVKLSSPTDYRRMLAGLAGADDAGPAADAPSPTDRKTP